MSKCSHSDVIDILREAEAVPGDGEIPVTASLKELGVQSLDKFNVFLLVEEKYGVVVLDDQFQELDTVEKITEHINAAG